MPKLTTLADVEKVLKDAQVLQKDISLFYSIKDQDKEKYELLQERSNKLNKQLDEIEENNIEATLPDGLKSSYHKAMDELLRLQQDIQFYLSKASAALKKSKATIQFSEHIASINMDIIQLLKEGISSVAWEKEESRWSRLTDAVDKIKMLQPLQALDDFTAMQLDIIQKDMITLRKARTAYFKKLETNEEQTVGNLEKATVRDAKSSGSNFKMKYKEKVSNLQKELNALLGTLEAAVTFDKNGIKKLSNIKTEIVELQQLLLSAIEGALVNKNYLKTELQGLVQMTEALSNVDNADFFAEKYTNLQEHTSKLEKTLIELHGKVKKKNLSDNNLTVELDKLNKELTLIQQEDQNILDVGRMVGQDVELLNLSPAKELLKINRTTLLDNKREGLRLRVESIITASDTLTDRVAHRWNKNNISELEQLAKQLAQIRQEKQEIPPATANGNTESSRLNSTLSQATDKLELLQQKLEKFQLNQYQKLQKQPQSRFPFLSKTSQPKDNKTTTDESLDEKPGAFRPKGDGGG